MTFHGRHTEVLATLLAVLLVTVRAAAQDQAAGGADPDRDPPIERNESVRSLDRIAILRVAPVDAEAALAEDVQREANGLPTRFAIAEWVDVSPGFDGTWESLPSGFSVWRLRVSSFGARSLNFGFVRYRMPAQGRLLIFSADQTQQLRAFTDADNEDHGELWTPPIESDDVVLEVVVPTSEVPQLELRLGSVNVGYRSFGEVASDPSGACNVDVACPAAVAWQNEIRAVGRMTVEGTKLCSGVMLNNTAEDFRPFFLTAEHCDVKQHNAASVIVYWNYQNSSCRLPGSAESGLAGDGQKDQFQTGAYLRASWPPVDSTLLELDDAPDPAWGVSYAGWDRSGVDPAGGVCIHHPRGYEKRISFEQESAYTTSYEGLVSPGDGTHLRIKDWDVGTTEPGSSGAPLFDPAHRVVGILHGGVADCGNDDSDWFARFALAWSLGESPETRLLDWLDPVPTGALTVDLITTFTVNVTPPTGTAHTGPVGGPFTNSEVVYTLRNPTGIATPYRVSSDRGLLTFNGGTAALAGVLPADGGTTQIVVGLSAAARNLSAGAYEDVLRVTDLARGLTATRRHGFAIGLTRFETAPSDGFLWGGPQGGPFNGSIVYALSNEQATPVSVRVSADVPWITLNGQPGPITVQLSGAEPFDAVAVGFSAAALNLPDGAHSGTVSFKNLSGGDGDTTRAITLEVGRIVYGSTSPPVPVRDLATISSFVDIPQDFCISDLNVEVDLRHTYIGDLIIDLVSPSGTVVRLHNSSGGGTDDLVRTYDNDGKGTTPDGPGTLTQFDSESTLGRWTLFVTDRARNDTGVLNSWRLSVAPEVANCPIPTLVYEWNMDADPHWTTQGLWAFGRPQGLGSFYGDPTSGRTGENVYGYNLQGDYQSGLSGAQYLTTSAIDCSQLTGTRLRFWRWLGVERSQFDKATVDVSRDGFTWASVWFHADPVELNDSVWTFQDFNISDIADGESAVRIRWGMGPTDARDAFPGWNIDDVQIWGVAPFDDCNRNSLPDANDLKAGRSRDCNGNQLPDECDIATGESGDCDQDGTPDECDCSSLRALLMESGGTMKSRYVSFIPPSVPCPIALRVRVQQSVAFSGLSGDAYWVGPPERVNEPGAPGGYFMAARLQCEPFVYDWSAVHLLHVYGAAVVPSTEYQVQAVRAGCLVGASPIAGDGFSPPLTVFTSKWGDAVAPFGGPFQPAFTDVAAVVDRFQGSLTAPIRPNLQLRPEVPNPSAPINFQDVAAELDAFKGVPYPYPIPQGCP